jgi:hypothetical protein
MNPGCIETLNELRHHAGGLHCSQDLAAFANALLLVGEQILQHDHLAFHALNFAHTDDFAAAVAQTADLHDQVNGRGHLLADGA